MQKTRDAASLRFVDPEDLSVRRAWDAAVDELGNGTVCHSTAWMDVVRKGLGLSPRFAYIPGPSNTVRALVPLFRAGGKLRPVRWLNLPQSCPSEPLAADEAGRARLIEQVGLAAAAEGASAVILRTPRTMEFAVPEGWEARREEPVLRHVIDLAGARDVKTLPNIQVGQRRIFPRVKRRLAAAGATVRLVGPGEGNVFARAVHHILLRRHGHLGLPSAFFEALLEILPDKARLQLVLPQTGPALAFSILLLNPDLGHLLYGSGLPTKEGADAYRLCVGMEIEATIAAGLRYFDFGETRPDQEGLIFFKETWGAARVDGSYLVIAKSGAGSGLRRIGKDFALAARLLRHMPVGLSLRIAGPIHRALQ